jgi:hypothetical protein
MTTISAAILILSASHLLSTAVPKAYMLRHDRALSLQNLPDFLRLLDEYRIQATLLAPSTPAVGLLDRLPEWKRAYSDHVAVVHMRR